MIRVEDFDAPMPKPRLCSATRKNDGYSCIRAFGHDDDNDPLGMDDNCHVNMTPDERYHHWFGDEDDDAWKE